MAKKAIDSSRQGRKNKVLGRSIDKTGINKVSVLLVLARWIKVRPPQIYLRCLQVVVTFCSLMMASLENGCFHLLLLGRLQFLMHLLNIFHQKPFLYVLQVYYTDTSLCSIIYLFISKKKNYFPFKFFFLIRIVQVSSACLENFFAIITFETRQKKYTFFQIVYFHSFSFFSFRFGI